MIMRKHGKTTLKCAHARKKKEMTSQHTVRKKMKETK